MVYNILRRLAQGLTLLVCRYRVDGQVNVPGEGPLLIVANHLSWYDPLLLGVVLPRRVWFFTKVEMFRWPVVGWLCRVTGQIPVKRGVGDREALDIALKYLQDCKAVVVFPEGTVERQEKMIAAHSGVAMLALRSHAMVLPIAHMGTRRVLRSWRQWFPAVYVHIDEPYIPTLPEGAARKAGLRMLTQELMERIARMLPPEQRGVYSVEITRPLRQ